MGFTNNMNGDGLFAPTTLTVNIPLGQEKKHRREHAKIDWEKAAIAAGTTLVSGLLIKGMSDRMDDLKEVHSPYVGKHLDRAKHQMLWNVGVTTVGTSAIHAIKGELPQEWVRAGLLAGAAETGIHLTKFVSASQFGKPVVASAANLSHIGLVNIRDNLTMGKRPLEEFTYNLGPVYLDIHPYAEKGKRAHVAVDPVQAGFMAWHVGTNIIGPGGKFDALSTFKTHTLVLGANKKHQEKMINNTGAAGYFMVPFGNVITVLPSDVVYEGLSQYQKPIDSRYEFKSPVTGETQVVNTPQEMLNYLNGAFKVQTANWNKYELADAIYTITSEYNATLKRRYNVAYLGEGDNFSQGVTEKEIYENLIHHEATHSKDRLEVERFTKPLSDKVDAWLHKHHMPSCLTTRGSTLSVVGVIPFVFPQIGSAKPYDDTFFERTTHAAEMLHGATNGLYTRFSLEEQRFFWDSRSGKAPYISMNAEGKFVFLNLPQPKMQAAPPGLTLPPPSQISHDAGFDKVAQPTHGLNAVSKQSIPIGVQRSQ